MVIPFVSLATPQMPEYTATLRAGAILGASLRCKPLVVNTQPRDLRLGLRPILPQRSSSLSINEPLPLMFQAIVARL
jgi:hypothetical protein